MEKVATLENVEAREEAFVRFGISQRIEHFALMVSFIMLSVTGLAQKFFEASWAAWTIDLLGGIDGTKMIHRVFAAVFAAVAVYHVSVLVYKIAFKKNRALMVPTVKDARDAINYLRYCIGLTDKQPEFGRYDYRQKFEYWGIIFGGLIMLVSGAILLWPIAVTSFLPGEVIPAALEFHSNEALLALLTIVVWHFYSAHFRPGTFPGDFSIFTGRISKDRMIEEHPLEYAELAREEDHRAEH